MIKKALLLFTLLILNSCGSYIAKMHREFDISEQKKINKVITRDKFALYRAKNKNHKFTSRDKKTLFPGIKRKYIANQAAKKRYTADDLVDNKNDASLWAGKGKDNYLFSVNTDKHAGDIIIINVLKNLKNDISSELRKTYPVNSNALKKSKSTEGKNPSASPATASTPQPNADKEEVKIHDKISSVIIEEISKDHLLLRGRKSILFRNRKRTVELQALVQRSDISEEGTVTSDQIIESNITVLR